MIFELAGSGLVVEIGPRVIEKISSMLQYARD